MVYRVILPTLAGSIRWQVRHLAAESGTDSEATAG